MSLQGYVHQLRPRKESYVNHIGKIQNLLTEADTGKATKSEQAIVVAYNMKKGMSEEEAYKKGGIPDTEWEKVSENLKADGKAIVNSMEDVGNYLVHYGRGSAQNYFGKNYNLPAKDTTPKTDLYSDTGRAFSLKDAKGAVLLSPKGGEATGVVKSAIENYQKHESSQLDPEIDDVVNFLKNDLDNLAMKGKMVEVSKSKDSFTNWYLTKSDRKSKLKDKTKSNDKDIEAHMKAELSFYKIPKQDRNYRKKLISPTLMLSKRELDDIYFPAFVQSEFSILDARINPKYAKTQDEKDLYADNNKLKEQAIQLLDIGIRQSEFHKKFAGVFENAGGLKKYIIYEAASGHYKFTGKLGTSYKGDDLAVAKELLEFQVKGDKAATKLYPNIFNWSIENESLLDDFVLDFKASGKSGYTKFAIPTKSEKLLEFVIDDTYKNIEEELNNLISERICLEEGVFDSIKRGFKSAKDAIVSITNQIKDVIKRFYKTVIFKFTEMIRKILKRDILLGIDSLGLDFQASVSFK